MSRRSLASPFNLACAAVIALGCFVRARPVLLADFPLNDGGLFYLMTDELRHAHYRLPMYTEYNAARIPFAYSPFGFYVAGAVAEVTSGDLAQVVRLLPLAVSCATLIAFLMLARSMLSERVTVVAAVAAFALVPRSFTWLVMGGGLTRAFGVLFTILALHQAYLLFTRRRLRFAQTAGLFTGLTVLSHLGTAPFLATSLALFFIAYGRHKHGLIGAAIIGVVAVAVSAPWWMTVAANHGFEPFLAAGQTGGSIFSSDGQRRSVLGRLVRFGAMTASEPFFPVIGALAVLGALSSVLRRAVLIPSWWIVTLALDARAGSTYMTLPLSLLAGIGVSDVLLPLLMRRPERVGAGQSVSPERKMRVRRWPPLPAAYTRAPERWIAGAALGVLVVYCTLAALTRDADFGTEGAYLVSLPRSQRDAMRWVASHTPPTSRFLVVSEEGWATDKAAEWFPVLARRPSVTTVQGTEWLPGRRFTHHAKFHDAARGCANRDARCLDQWSDASGLAFSHIFIPKAPAGACCGQLSASLRSDPDYELVYDGPGAEIYARSGAEVATWTR